MAKKLMQLLLLLACILFVAWGAAYVKKSGMLEPYPDTEFLTKAEAESKPLYQQLSEKEKAVYTALYRGISEHKSEISLPYEVDGEVYSKLYRFIEKQESSFFYIDSTYFTAERLRTAQIVFREGDDYAVMADELQEAANKILSRIPASADEYTKALYIHDYIVDNCVYEISGDAGYDATAYGCLIDGAALCEGYAKAFDYLAKESGLKSTVITGTTDDGENHAWNQVEVNGAWYNIDVTWDDTDKAGDKRHTYFMCSDDGFSLTHFADTAFYSPFECLADKDNYYIRSDLYIETLDDAERILRRETEASFRMIELKFANKSMYDSFKQVYITDERIFEILMEGGSPILGQSVSLTLKEIEKELYMVIALS